MLTVISRIVGVVLVLVSATAQGQQPEPLAFGVINQRSVVLMAASWNPILAYVSQKAGVPLALKIGKTAPETTAITARGEHVFAFTNHMFTPERDALGYKAIVRIKGEPIRGAIVVRSDSPVKSVQDLYGRMVAFPSREAFLAHGLPLEHLNKLGVSVQEMFAGNQEGAMAQLQVGQVAAAAVNQSLLEKYTQRRDFDYRVIWISEPYPDIPVMVHPAVPPAVVAAVRKAFVGMAQDREGRAALKASADAIELKEPWSFVAVEDKDYDGYRAFYRKAAGKDARR